MAVESRTVRAALDLDGLTLAFGRAVLINLLQLCVAPEVPRQGIHSLKLRMLRS